MKRQRGRGRKSNGGGQNRNYESNGPDVKIRGSASHVHEKYQQLARDAASAGDRIAAESYLQHADHYFRLMRAQQQHQRDRAEEAAARDAGAGGREETGEANAAETSSPMSNGGPLEVVDPEAAEAASSSGSGDEDAGREESRPRRTRRPRRPRQDEARSGGDEAIAADDASSLDAS